MRSRAEELLRDAEERLYDREAMAKDPHYAYQVRALRDVVLRLDAVLDGEGIPDEQGARIIRAVLYGQPSTAEAYLGMHARTELARLRMMSPPPIVIREPQ